jgi:hypothetical protein
MVQAAILDSLVLDAPPFSQDSSEKACERLAIAYAVTAFCLY